MSVKYLYVGYICDDASWVYSLFHLKKLKLLKFSKFELLKANYRLSKISTFTFIIQLMNCSVTENGCDWYQYAIY